MKAGITSIRMDRREYARKGAETAVCMECAYLEKIEMEIDMTGWGND